MYGDSGWKQVDQTANRTPYAKILAPFLGRTDQVGPVDSNWPSTLYQMLHRGNLIVRLDVRDQRVAVREVGLNS